MGARILVADDSVTIQKVVELTFSKEDFTLTQARSGEETIRKAKEMRPDLVLLDLVMPDMNGYDVCAALRAEPVLRSVPIILLTGTFESFDRQRGAQAGANDFVTKPFESQVLIGKVKQLLFAKAVEGSKAADAKPSAEAIAAKTLPVASALSLAQPLLEPVAAAETSPPPTPPPEPSQEELWELLGASLAVPPNAAAPSEEPEPLRVGEIAFAGPPPEPETPPVDLGALELEPFPVATESAADAMDVLPLPESLSLDDLLATASELPAVAPPAEASAGAALAGEPVFELSAAEAAPLPMVEVGKGGPPALPIEELLGSPAPESAQVDAPTLELPELDLSALPEAGAAASAEVEPPAPARVEEAEAFPEFRLEGVVASAEEWAASEASLSSETSEYLPPPGAAGPLPPPAEVGPPRIPGDAAPLQMDEIAAAPSAVAAAVPAAPEAAGLASIGMTPSEMAAMREAVTERVAHDLKHELSEKLLERFEKIVWEVVPDLAEILITKEIERIRRLADEEKSS
jgi:CheY-like chemotaxis protein